MIAVNEEVIDAPEMINQDPYATWLLEVAEVTDTEDLLNAAEYEAFVKEEG